MEWPWAILSANLHENQKVLDIGASWSIFKFALAKRSAFVRCLDLDKEGAEYALGTITKLKIGQIFQDIGDMRDMPYLDNFFDAVFCISVLEHVEGRYEKALEECIRVLKPGGKFLLTFDVLLAGKSPNTHFIDCGIMYSILSFLGIHKIASQLPEGNLHGTDIGPGTFTVVLVEFTKE